MAVRIRMKMLGRRHRPFFRVCAMDSRTARDGRVIEELGFYDPMAKETDARAVLNGERIDYWLGVGAQATEKVKTLIKKYGANGTHLEQQKAALERLAANKPSAPPPLVVPKREDEAVSAAPSAEAPSGEGNADESAPEAAAEHSAEGAETSSSEEKTEGGE